MTKYYSGPHTQITTDVGGELQLLESVSWGYSAAFTKAKGVGSKFRGYTKGIFNVDDGSLEIYQEAYDSFISALGGPEAAMTESEFELTVTLTAVDGDVSSIVLKRCKLNTVSSTVTTTDEGVVLVSCGFQALDIEHKNS